MLKNKRNRVQRVGFLLLVVFGLYLLYEGSWQEAWKSFIGALLITTLADLKTALRMLYEKTGEKP